MGYQSSLNAIFVSFQGSQDINNWVTNLDILTTAYPYCDGCEVHAGFYGAQRKVIDGIMSEVKSLRQKYSSATIVVVGHSLGAALATLTALDFVHAGLSPIKLFNYGSPRVGNTNFADWVTKTIEPSGKIQVTRSTHYKDMVVHVPMHERFTHIAGEIYEDLHSNGPLYDCQGEEDEKCSYQWHITSVDDHLLYQGLVMGGSGCAAVSA